MIDPRLLPDGFLETYRRHLGGEPPEEFLEAYDLLCDALYYGTALKPVEVGGGKRGKGHAQFWFGDDSLLGLKWAVDRRLAAIGTAIRLWAEARARKAARRPEPEAGRGSDLARARGTGDLGPDARDEEA